MLQTYGAAALVILASLVVGQATCRAIAGARRWYAAPAVGLAVLVVVASVAIKLPGHAVTAAVAILVVLAAAGAWLVRHGGLRLGWREFLVASLALMCASLPFIASGRVGIPGVSLDDDTANHLVWAETLRASRMASLYSIPSGYPIGPHSLVAALGVGTGMSLDRVVTALLLAVVTLTALLAAGALAREAVWRQAAIGLLASLGYLDAAYFAEGAFKETMLAAFVLAFLLHLQQVRAGWGRGTTTGGRWRQGIPAGLLVAGGIYVYSYLAVAWFGLSVIFWAIAEVVMGPSLLLGGGRRRRLSDAAPVAIGALALAAVALIPSAARVHSFFAANGFSPAGNGTVRATNVGNLVGALSPYEGLGIWMNADFRFPPTNAFHAGELSALALGVLVFGIGWSVRRRELLLPAGLAACALIWWRSSHTQSPYVTAKALVVAGPLVMTVGLRALLARRGTGEDPWAAAFKLAIAAVFVSFAAYSSYQVLRSEPVQAPEPGSELDSFRATIGDAPVLFLGNDDFAPWQLRETRMSALAQGTVSLGKARPRPNKPFVYGLPLDFDSVGPADLDRFRYVITSNSPFASQVPPNFRLIRTMRLYELWRRTGPTTPRQTLESTGQPGAVLDCGSPTGRMLHTKRGTASVLTPPVGVATPGMPPGTAASVAVPLPRGAWDLSLQYISNVQLDLSAQGMHWSMPAYLGRPGPFFRFGSVTGGGPKSPVAVTLTAHRPSFLSGPNLVALPTAIVATRRPDVRRLVPLRDSCGQYIDWYQLY